MNTYENDVMENENNESTENENTEAEETEVIICKCCGSVIENHETDHITEGKDYIKVEDENDNVDYYCADCIGNGELDDYTVCDECGKIILADDAEEIDDSGAYCKDCIAEKVREGEIQVCDDCDKYFTVSQMEHDSNGTYLCQYCYDNGGYAHCDDCGNIIYCGDVYIANRDISNERYVCGNCISYYYRCDECGDYFGDEYIHSDDNDTHICDSCFEHFHYHRCDNCNCIISEDYQNWDNDDNCYCDDCYYVSARSIHDYGYKPSPEFFNVYNEEPTEEYLGVELECDQGVYPDDTAEEVTDIMDFNGWNHLYCKHDGSLDNGFEMVSFPCTLRYHMEVMPWSDVMKKCISKGFRSHDTTTCGLHVHVSRKAFGNTTDEQDLAIAKTIMLIDKFWDKVVRFTRRKSDRINHWAAPCNIDITENDKFADIVDKVKKTKDKGRYQAVNLTNYNTVEFRIFRGTLKYNTFIASLQFVSTLVRYAKQVALIDIWRVGWDDIFYNTEYIELKNYLKERNLYGTSLSTTATVTANDENNDENEDDDNGEE